MSKELARQRRLNPMELCEACKGIQRNWRKAPAMPRLVQRGNHQGRPQDRHRHHHPLPVRPLRHAWEYENDKNNQQRAGRWWGADPVSLSFNSCWRFIYRRYKPISFKTTGAGPASSPLSTCACTPGAVPEPTRRRVAARHICTVPRPPPAPSSAWICVMGRLLGVFLQDLLQQGAWTGRAPWRRAAHARGAPMARTWVARSLPSVTMAKKAGGIDLGVESCTCWVTAMSSRAGRAAAVEQAPARQQARQQVHAQAVAVLGDLAGPRSTFSDSSMVRGVTSSTRQASRAMARCSAGVHCPAGRVHVRRPGATGNHRDGLHRLRLRARGA